MLRQHQQWLYHIATAPDWDQARQEGEYRTSTRGRTLSEEGFIHASTAAQVLPVANAVYRDEQQDLVLLVLDSSRITAEIRREPVPGWADPFPHIYGPLDVAAVVQAVPLERDAAGGFRWPAGLARRVLYVIACAAPPAADVSRLVSLAQQRGWDVCVLTTPSGRRFTDPPALERQTGHPVRSEYKNPGEPDVLPDPDAVIVAPATVNTINKWAAGICDTLALGILVEAIGKQLPIVALPSTNQAHAAHPVFPENIGKLRSWGVSVLFGAGVHGLPEPGADGPGPDRFPWSATLDALDASTAQTGDG